MIVVIIIVVLVIWFFWGLNNKHRVADKIVANGGMRVVYSTLVNEFLSMDSRVIVEKKDRIHLVVYGTEASVMYINIAQNFDEVSVDVIVAHPQLGKVHKLFSFPMNMNQKLMLARINTTIEKLIEEKME